MTFNINNQTAGVVNNVAGDQQIYGGQTGTLVQLNAARDAARDLRSALDLVGLSRREAGAARGHADAIAAELGRSNPDRPRVADRLSKLAGLILAAGSLATAGLSIAGPLRVLIGWLGHLGEPIVQMLPFLK